MSEEHFGSHFSAALDPKPWKGDILVKSTPSKRCRALEGRHFGENGSP
jgi:hypothetical protein